MNNEDQIMDVGNLTDAKMLHGILVERQLRISQSMLKVLFHCMKKGKI